MSGVPRVWSLLVEGGTGSGNSRMEIVCRDRKYTEWRLLCTPAMLDLYYQGQMYKSGKPKRQRNSVLSRPGSGPRQSIAINSRRDGLSMQRWPEYPGTCFLNILDICTWQMSSITPSAESSSVDGQSQAYDVGGSQGAHKSRWFEAETREELVEQTQVVKCILLYFTCSRVDSTGKSLIAIFCTSPGFDILPRNLHPRWEVSMRLM